MSNRPPSGHMVYWRYRDHTAKDYRFGYVTYVSGHDLIRMGRWNGDSIGGPVVSCNDIEWVPYTDHLRS